MNFNIAKLIEDCGGASKLAASLGVARTTPYRWLQQGMISSRMLVRIKQSQPTINIDNYIEGDSNDEKLNAERSSGVSG